MTDSDLPCDLTLDEARAILGTPQRVTCAEYRTRTGHDIEGEYDDVGEDAPDWLLLYRGCAYVECFQRRDCVEYLVTIGNDGRHSLDLNELLPFVALYAELEGLPTCAGCGEIIDDDETVCAACARGES